MIFTRFVVLVVECVHDNYNHHLTTTQPLPNYPGNDYPTGPHAMTMYPKTFHVNHESHVNHAGGIVLLRYLRIAGVPALQFQRSARAGEGEDFRKLYAHLFHMVRKICRSRSRRLLTPLPRFAGARLPESTQYSTDLSAWHRRFRVRVQSYVGIKKRWH